METNGLWSQTNLGLNPSSVFYQYDNKASASQMSFHLSKTKITMPLEGCSNDEMRKKYITCLIHGRQGGDYIKHIYMLTKHVLVTAKIFFL